MSSVRKRLLPSGEVRWQVDYKDGQGKRRSKQFRTKREADAYDTRVRGELAAGTHVAESQSKTVKEIGELWLQRAIINKLEPSTVRQYKQHLDLHIVPLIGDMKVVRLTSPAIVDFRDKLLLTRSKALSRAILASLKAILSEAQMRGLVGHNVAANTKIKDARRDKEEVEVPSKEEIRLILARSDELWPLTRQLTSRGNEGRVVGLPWRPLILTAIFTGLRAL